MPQEKQAAWTLTARWVFPVDGPPLERGTVTVAGARIQAVEAHGIRGADHDFGNAALLPGLVNAHTHLDLTGLHHRTPPTSDFTAWLRSVIAHRRSLSPTQLRADVQTGLEMCRRHGTTLLGDISAQGLSWDLLTKASLHAIVFHELLGLPPERADAAIREARAWLETHPPADRTRPGLSPHAPYSVRRSLFEGVASLARAQPVPVAIHLAESAAELELLEHHEGPFVEFLRELGVWDPSGLVGGPAEVLRLFADVPGTLFVHGNYLDAAGLLPRAGSIVYCPRTHARFGHPGHPFRELMAAGVRVALGTDSLASNPDLDVLAEARFVQRAYPEVAGRDLLRMATLSGAEALGWQAETGSLTPGKFADLVVVPLPAEEAEEPHRLVLESSLPVQAVLWRGQWVVS